MTLVDKKVKALGEHGGIMYFTPEQLNEAQTKYPQYTFHQVHTVSRNPLPKSQKAYIIGSIKEEVTK